MRLAVPNFFETLGMWVGNFLVVIFVGLLGAGLLGAHIIAIRLEALSFLPGFAIGMAAATLAGQYLGAGRPDLAKRAIWRCAMLASAFMGLFGAAFILIPGTLVGLMSAQPVHLKNTPAVLAICGIVQVPFALGIVLRSALRGAGDVRVVMVLTWFSTYLIRLPLAFLLSGVDTPLLQNPMPDNFTVAGVAVHGLQGLWIGLCIDLALRGALFLGRYLQGGWTRAKV
ncbi:MAG: MATE family efflux transporter [Planctomycetota bacterium]